MNSPDPTGKPTLESLLRLKRFERPDPEFWQQFEGELRRKQLAATIEPKPWWLGLAALSRKAAPFGLPAGAAAALTLAAVSLQTTVWSPGDGNEGVSTVASANPTTTTTGVLPTEAQPADTVIATSSVIEDVSVPPILIASSAPVAVEESVATEPAVSAPASVPFALDVALVSLLPGIGLQKGDSVPSLVEPTPSQRHIAYNLAVAEQEHPMLGGVFGLRLARADGIVAAPEQSPETRSVSEATLGEITPRTARLLALVDATPAAEAAVVSANIAREQAVRLNDDILYASANRLGLGGDRLSIRF